MPENSCNQRVMVHDDSAELFEKWAFRERELDTETDLQYHRARSYDSTVGRWLDCAPLNVSLEDRAGSS